MPVNVVPYNPQWKDWYEELREPIWKEVRELAIDIIHVGSTSVEGMSAKPVIDIDIVIDDWSKFAAITQRLNKLGYLHVGDLGIKDREAFKPSAKSVHDHHLYVVHKDSIAYRNHILLRKHLRENSEAFKRYCDLKRQLADTAVDIDAYTRSKTELILGFLRAEGLSDKELEETRRENLA